MISLPPAPHPGDRVSAELLRNILRCLRAATPLAGPGILLSRGPNGTVVSAMATAAPRHAAPDRSCWRIVAGTRTPEPEAGQSASEAKPEPVRKFADCYCTIGGTIKLYEPKADECVEDFVCQGEVAEGEEYSQDDKPFVCFERSALYNHPLAADETGTADANDQTEAKIVGYRTLEAVREAQRDLAKYVKPLYVLTHDGSVKTDLRTAQTLQMWEPRP